jgi:pimeloyl-ACP methyl ester carboxylesterase
VGGRGRTIAIWHNRPLLGGRHRDVRNHDCKGRRPKSPLILSPPIFSDSRLPSSEFQVLIPDVTLRAAPRSAVANARARVHDQLGTGDSDKPKDTSLWTIGRYVEEVETVREALKLGKIHLLGHSWGGWLSIEYALTHLKALKSLVLSSTCGDMPHLVTELDRHRAALGPETVAMMQRHEAEGTLKHPEYDAAITRYLSGTRVDAVAPAEPHEFSAQLRLKAGDCSEVLPFYMTEPAGHHHQPSSKRVVSCET